ncbi:hypothetical protein L1887_55307 [Cichorium endivia]|nr:hypothetical protein L1887_55307 [Cichorium endivia]
MSGLVRAKKVNDKEEKAAGSQEARWQPWCFGDRQGAQCCRCGIGQEEQEEREWCGGKTDHRESVSSSNPPRSSIQDLWSCGGHLAVDCTCDSVRQLGFACVCVDAWAHNLLTKLTGMGPRLNAHGSRTKLPRSQCLGLERFTSPEEIVALSHWKGAFWCCQTPGTFPREIGGSPHLEVHSLWQLGPLCEPLEIVLNETLEFVGVDVLAVCVCAGGDEAQHVFCHKDGEEPRERCAAAMVDMNKCPPGLSRRSSERIKSAGPLTCSSTSIAQTTSNCRPSATSCSAVVWR